MKGALATLETKAGNDWDTATLVWELFHEAGITLAYANGQILEHKEDVLNLLGAANAKGAYDILDYAGLQPGLYKTANGTLALLNPSTEWAQTEYIAFNHTYLHRAAGGGLPEMYLDPAWKHKDYESGIAGLAGNVPFDTGRETSYWNTVRTEPAYEFYEGEVREYLRLNYPASTMRGGACKKSCVS